MESGATKALSVGEMLLQRVERDFTYHAPSGRDVKWMAEFREAAKALAKLAVEHSDPVAGGRELAQCLTSLELAVQHYNAGLARHSPF